MYRIKRLTLVLIVLIISFIAVLSVLQGLKNKGYSYLFHTNKPYDLVIKYAQILDGAGENKAFRGDIAVRDGKIVGVGYVNAQDSPVFDAGGLTIIPWPIKIEKTEEALEHLLRHSYPRYPADQIFLQDPPYEGLSLRQAAYELGMGVDSAYKILEKQAEPETKVWLIPFDFAKDKFSNEELLAQLTGYRAEFFGLQDQGIIRKDYKADFYIYKSRDVSAESLNVLLKRGRIPEPIYKVKEGNFTQQENTSQ